LYGGCIGHNPNASAFFLLSCNYASFLANFHKYQNVSNKKKEEGKIPKDLQISLQ